MLSLSRLVRRTRPDVMHGHSSIGGVLARVTAQPRVGRVWTPNGVLTSPPVIAIERLLGRRTDRVVAVSRGEAELLTSLRVVPRERLVVIPNGIELDQPARAELDLRRHLDLADDVPLVGAVGRLARQKAPLVYADACRRVAVRNASAHFVLIGDGPMADEVAAAVRGWDHDNRFHQLGALDNAAALLDQLDVLVQVSLYEGGPYVPLEAMRAGVPLVLSDVVGNQDTIVADVSGVLVPANDAEATASAISRLLADSRRRTSLAQAATKLLHDRFDVRIMGEAHVELYEAVAKMRATS
jgi:glycosyltransferase involved in cell wall biosynthesis